MIKLIYSTLKSDSILTLNVELTSNPTEIVDVSPESLDFSSLKKKWKF